MPHNLPQAIVEAACTTGSAETRLPISKQLVTGIMAGVYIGLAALLSLAMGYGSPILSETSPGLGRLLAGAILPIGFMLVVITGSELFTGNICLTLPACLAGATKWRALLRSWGVVYLGNFVGAACTALLFGYLAGIVSGGDPGKTSVAMAEVEVRLGWGTLFLRGIACNWLIGLAFWVSMASEDITGKLLGMWFPLMLFGALGLEHSVANMFVIPLGMLNGANIGVGQFLWNNLLPVTLGNIIGGAGLVGALYWWVYGRD
jgi:formate transporter